jgi:FKBP-type peptidyl-prolyl cis-trans isomerase 2
MLSIRYLLISTIGLVLLLGAGCVANPPQKVQDGAKVTVGFHITPRESPTTTYSDTEQFIQGQHSIPPVIEQRVAGMHPGEVKTFALSAEEAFGPYDETNIETIPLEDLPLDAKEGDTVEDRAGRSAKIVRILPEKALLDLNHPLAGKPLLVTLQIVTIENPDEGATTR